MVNKNDFLIIFSFKNDYQQKVINYFFLYTETCVITKQIKMPIMFVFLYLSRI